MAELEDDTESHSKDEHDPGAEMEVRLAHAERLQLASMNASSAAARKMMGLAFNEHTRIAAQEEGIPIYEGDVTILHTDWTGAGETSSSDTTSVTSSAARLPPPARDDSASWASCLLVGVYSLLGCDRGLDRLR